MTTVSWIPFDPPGRFGLMPRPRGGEWLADDVSALARSGVTHLVSLLEPDEAGELLLGEERGACEAVGMGFTSHPIPDMGLPPSPDPFWRLAEELARRVREGQSVVVHCRAGIGRSGLMAGAVLVERGFEPETALLTASLARGWRVPETDEQVEWFLRHANARHAARRRG